MSESKRLRGRARVREKEEEQRRMESIAVEQPNWTPDPTGLRKLLLSMAGCKVVIAIQTGAHEKKQPSKLKLEGLMGDRKLDVYP